MLKMKCYRKEIHLLTYLIQPLSSSLVFAFGQESLISTQTPESQLLVIDSVAWQSNTPWYKEQRGLLSPKETFIQVSVKHSKTATVSGERSSHSVA